MRGRQISRFGSRFQLSSRLGFEVAALFAVSISAISFLLFPPHVAAVSCIFGWTMLAIAVSDAQRFIVPDILSLPCIPAGLIATRVLAEPPVRDALVLDHAGAAVLGATALYGLKQLYLILRKREGLGLGDVKLAAVAGSWTGFQGLSNVLLLACILAIAYVVLSNLRNLRAVDGTFAVPFGVFLGPSIWLVWCAGTLSS